MLFTIGGIAYDLSKVTKEFFNHKCWLQLKNQLEIDNFSHSDNQ
jgi:hypothetical protein